MSALNGLVGMPKTELWQNNRHRHRAQIWDIWEESARSNKHKSGPLLGVEDMPSPMTDPMAQLTQTGGAEKRQKAPGERDRVKRMHHVAAPSFEAQLKSASPAEPRLEHDHKAAFMRQAEAAASQKVLRQLASEASAIVDKGSVDAAAKTSTRTSTSTTNSKRRSEAQAVRHLMHHLMEQVDWIVRN